MYITHELSSMIIAYVILTFIFYVLNGIVRLIKNPPFRKNICDHLIADFEKRINIYQRAIMSIKSLKQNPVLLKSFMYPIYIIILLVVLSIVSLGITILTKLI